MNTIFCASKNVRHNLTSIIHKGYEQCKGLVNIITAYFLIELIHHKE